MSGRRIGKAWWKTRQGNDLDDYLAEVEEHLFCVHPEDRECLLRDLKAHVRELTTDPAHVYRFNGMYGITQWQLTEEFGNSREVARDYTRFSHIVPSRTLSIFLVLYISFFLILIYEGIQSIHAYMRFPKEGLTPLALGVVFIGIGIFSNFISYMNFRNLARYIHTLPYLSLIIAFISYPVSFKISRFFDNYSRQSAMPGMTPLFTAMFFIDLSIIAMLGLYVTMQHVRVIESTRRDAPEW